MTRDEVAEVNENLLVLDPPYMDAAILGVCGRVNLEAVLYDSNKVVELLMREEGMSCEEATEWFEFNIEGAWVGEHSPVFVSLA